MINLQLLGVDWDEGNRKKCHKHGLSSKEIEDFFAQDVLVTPDISHSQEEERFLAVGRSRKSKTMMVVFTFRESKGKLLIRPISARYMREKESKRYEQEDSKIEK
jgi:hypothetical protein